MLESNIKYTNTEITRRIGKKKEKKRNYMSAFVLELSRERDKNESTRPSPFITLSLHYAPTKT